MAVLRDRPYLQFNFLVDFGTGSTGGPEAGFAEVSGVGMEVTVSEYRATSSRENSITKITGTNKSTEVTLKRGIIESRSLHDWLNPIQTGGPAADRTVTIQLQNEDHTQIVLTWMLHRARIIKFTGPVSVDDTHMAVEVLVLACEHVETH